MIVVYSMLYIDSDNSDSFSVNGGIKVLGYVKCCELLKSSLEIHQVDFVLLTNDKLYVEKNSNGDLNIKEIEIKLDVPKDIKFYGAHFKIDAFRYLANLKDNNYHVLVDSDVLCVNTIPLSLRVMSVNNIPGYYNITDQVFPAFGEEKIITDKELLMNEKSTGLWTGGEFHSGCCSYFDRLYRTSMNYWRSYKINYYSLHHQGDEMIVSCAIEKLLSDRIYMVDVGKFRVIHRYWSVKTLHISPPLNACYDSFFVHLPADKMFLSSQKSYIHDIFPNSYIKYLKKRDGFFNLIRRFLKIGIKKITN